MGGNNESEVIKGVAKYLKEEERSTLDRISEKIERIEKAQTEEMRLETVLADEIQNLNVQGLGNPNLGVKLGRLRAILELKGILDAKILEEIKQTEESLAVAFIS